MYTTVKTVLFLDSFACLFIFTLHQSIAGNVSLHAISWNFERSILIDARARARSNVLLLPWRLSLVVKTYTLDNWSRLFRSHSKHAAFNYRSRFRHSISRLSILDDRQDCRATFFADYFVYRDQFLRWFCDHFCSIRRGTGITYVSHLVLDVTDVYLPSLKLNSALWSTLLKINCERQCSVIHWCLQRCKL